MQRKATVTQLDIPRTAAVVIDPRKGTAKDRVGERADDADKRIARRLEKKRLYAESLARKSGH